ncbi:MAG: 1-phosphofructokinase [Methanotrichaceae archaeon]|nr:1-phosphofructokinase [Methanotrichaceae archaeon]
MIYTITLNPALDRTIWVDRIREDESNRIEEEHRYAGGKSIDVSKVLKNLGLDSVALGFVGGFAGRELEGRLLNEGIQSDFIRVSGETRINIIIHEMETKHQVAFNARGPQVQPHELMELVDQVSSLRNADIITIGGSLPRGVTPEIVRKLITMAKKGQTKVFLDVDGEALKVGIEAGPHIIKPNIHELSHLLGRELTNIEDILVAAREINKKGVEIVLVSMGARGILMVTEDEEQIALPPQVEVKNTIGAGDSSVAGFILGLVSGKELKECLAFAAAAGTATTLSHGTALCRKEDFDRILPQVQLKELR